MRNHCEQPEYTTIAKRDCLQIKANRQCCDGGAWNIPDDITKIAKSKQCLRRNMTGQNQVHQEMDVSADKFV